MNFRFTPKQPQIILENGVLTLAKNGDFDKNNVVDSNDAKLLLEKLASKEQFTGFQAFVSDFDKNGKIQAFDCAKILEFSEFGIFTPEIFSFTIPEFEAEDFAVNSSTYSLKVKLNNSVSLNSVSATVKIPQEFAIDSVKIGTDFSSFLQTQSIKVENEFSNINLGLASSNNLLNGNLEFAEIFLTPLQTKNSSQIILSDLVTNIEPEQTDKILEMEILENSNNDSLDLIFSDSKFVGMNEQFELSLFTKRISSFWQVKDLVFEIHFPTSKFSLESFSSNYFEDISRATQIDKIEIRAKTTIPKDFSGNLFEFVFSSIERNLLPKENNLLEIKELKIDSNFPFQFLENQANLISFKEGDLNVDNSTNQNDVQELMTQLSKFEIFDEFETKTVDFDNSETVNSFDASLLMRLLDGDSINISKNFSDSHFLNFPDSTLKNESFSILFSMAESENIRSVRGKFNLDKSAFKHFRTNFLGSTLNSEFTFNNFGFCFASSSETKNELFSFGILPLQTGDFEITLTDFEINGIAQPSQTFTITVKENDGNELSPFGFPYPNPISNGILKVDTFEKFETVNYEIFNLLGKSIDSKKVIPNQNRIEIQMLSKNRKKLANGTYFLKLEGKTQTSTNEQIKIFTILN